MWSSRGCLGAPAGTKACGRTSSPTVAPGAADGPHPGVSGFLDGPLGGHSAGGLVVDLDEAQIVLGDLVGLLGAVPAVQERLERVPPDRAADREADEALDRRGLLEPVVDLLVGGAAAQEHALDVLAARALARLCGEHLGVLAAVDALDLPDVDLDAGLLEVLDRAPHQLGAQLGVVAVGVAVDRVQLGLL